MKKNFTKSKMITLICAILIVVVAVGFFVPYTLAYFVKKDKFAGDSTTPNISCEIVGTGFKNTPITINNTQMFVANTAFNGTNNNGTSVAVEPNSNIKTLLRVKLTFKLASSNTGVTSSDLTSINSNFTASVDGSKWILGTDDDTAHTKNTINAANLSTYYLYYKSVIPANSTSEISVYTNFAQISDSNGYYNGKYLLAELYCEAIQANEAGANKWVASESGTIPAWASTWKSGLSF